MAIDESANPSLAEIAGKARRLQAECGLDLLILDYLSLMRLPGRRSQNRNEEIAEISRGLKQLAKELRLPVLVLQQLNREPERRSGDHRPRLSNLRDSGAIEQDADMVCFLYRDEVYHPDDVGNRGIAELILAKQRNGETGTVELAWRAEIASFGNPGRE